MSIGQEKCILLSEAFLYLSKTAISFKQIWLNSWSSVHKNSLLNSISYPSPEAVYIRTIACSSKNGYLPRIMLNEKKELSAHDFNFECCLCWCSKADGRGRVVRRYAGVISKTVASLPLQLKLLTFAFRTDIRYITSKILFLRAPWRDGQPLRSIYLDFLIKSWFSPQF